MRHAEFNSAAVAPLAPSQAARPASAIGGGSGFGRVFSEMHSEISDFISEGGGDTGAAALSVEGRMWQARTQGVANAMEPAGGQQAFLENIAPWAREAGERLGVAPELVQAHAALESGWGQRPLTNAAGDSTHNLFGLKAGGKWDGDVAESLTTEFEHGAAVKKTERFRAYPDQASAFRDYAQMLLENPRYRGAIGAGSDARAFAEGLARGGYATDPQYASKLARLATRLQGVSE
ncbi:flagellar assembly peptidoglycan hydrolase FlgJ [Massilia sp. RP-1-19]|uniref:Flagellar assembly peptidoglycan hydrolase FlgJ n=1 Tax=Massilia polaris TaxID=2728846 RepID=A0A848HQC4_9BURK|nr:glucosaminidase domain-containing protein [Massilia polaris]NML63314.1 flagellar assembly peptidoglycan hydrolase FlgJ [Massilia polaris]